ncbi:hypothetical protein J4Q44_G00274880 [Coregonus suidteri]|uniref:Uncharacterized protein n=1 Tax=Coregonus suidteri TaxID=861788 RepID=A0AAN8L9D9_9TELE
MNRSRTTVEGHGEKYVEEEVEDTQAGARREEEVQQGFSFRLGSLVSRVSRGDEEAQEESQFSASGLGGLVRRVSRISGLGGEQVLDSPGEEGSVSGRGSLVSRGVSWMFPDAGRLLRCSPPRVLQQVWDSTGVLQPGARGRAGSLQPGAWGGASSSWSSQVVSMVKENRVLSMVKDSQVFSFVRESHMFSYVKDSQVFSMASELPLVQHLNTALTQDFRSIPIALTQDLQPVESTGIQQRAIVLNTAPKINLTTHNTVLSPATSLYLAQNAIEFPHKQNTGKEVDRRTGEQNLIRKLEWTPVPEGREDALSTSEEQSITKEELWSPEDQIEEDPQCVTDGANGSKPQSPPEQGDNARSAGPEKSSVPGQRTEGVQVYYQRLVEFPGALVKLQSLPVSTLLGCLQSVLPSVLTSQRLLALCWLGVANCSQPRPHPSLVLLLESCLYALTLDPDTPDQTMPLTVFHHLPLLQIKEIQVGFGGQSLRLTASSEESVLTLYTHR